MTQFSPVLEVDGRKLPLSNLEKVLYPKAGFTKGDVIDYYVKVSYVLLPHLRDRALTLKCYPNGVEGESFDEKRCLTFPPDWLNTAPVWSDNNHATINCCLANDLPSLIWAANLSHLELHTSLACYQKPERPTAMVFDLDPGPGTDIIDCAELALLLRDLLDLQSLKCFPKTSGSEGLQIYVPLNSPATFAQTKNLARALAEQIVRQRPEKAVAPMAKQLRNNRVFIDWLQNEDDKTSVCVYSLRAKEHPTVSTPLKWTEVEQAVEKREAKDLQFEAADAVKRIKKLGDLFAPVLELKQKLPSTASFT